MLNYCCPKCRYASEAFRTAVSTAVLNFSNEKKLHKTLACKQTKKERYGNENYNNHEQTVQTCIERYDGAVNVFQVQEIKDLAAETKEQRYGNKRYVNGEKISLTYSQKSDEEFDIKTEQQRKTYKEKTGYDFPMKNPEVKQKAAIKLPETLEKRNSTKRKNHTFNTSEPEKMTYSLLYDVFQDNVVQQYRSDKYPFNCDFYIKCLDLYIECNFHWTHGGHFFDQTNIADVQLVEKWKLKNTEFYNCAIETWTIRDTKKLNTAITNNLNYLVFWNLDEVKVWLSSLNQSK